MRRVASLAACIALSGLAAGADLELTYSVKVDNLTSGDVSFRLD